MYLRAEADQAGRRIDNFLLAQYRRVPKSRVYRMIRCGEVRVNGGRVRADYRIQTEDRIRLPPVRMRSARECPPSRGQQQLLAGAVLYADAAVLVVNKPAGLSVHAGSGCAHGSIEILRSLHEREPKLDLVHRLDRLTSGCLLIARGMSALCSLHRQWQTGRVEKRYRALLSGCLPRREHRIEAPLRRVRAAGGIVAVDKAGRSAITHFRVDRCFAAATLATVTLGTGRTHQIRVHAQHMGHPVAGDPKYAPRETNKAFRSLGLKRMFLHAESLEFVSPATRHPVRVTAPLPADLQAFLEVL